MLTGSRNLFESVQFIGSNFQEVIDFAHPYAYTNQTFDPVYNFNNYPKKLFLSIQTGDTSVDRLRVQVNDWLVKSVTNEGVLFVLNPILYNYLLEDF